MTARLNTAAFHDFLSQLFLAERALAEQYRRTLRRCTDPDLAVSFATAADSADRRADGLELLMADMGMGGPSALPMPPVIAAVQNEPALTRGDGRMTSFQDVEGLLMAEQWRHTAVSCVRAVASVTDDHRLTTAVDFLEEASIGRINWLQGLTACFAAGAFAPQQAGTPLPPHPQRRPARTHPTAPPSHGDEFTHGPDASPV